MNERWLPALGLTCLVLLASIPVSAQTHFASFTGTVTSSDGNPVPGVEVVATNEATQVTYTADEQRRRASTRSPPSRSAPTRSGRRRRTSGPSRPTRSSSNPARTRASTSRCTVGATEKGRGHRRHPDPADPGRGRRRGHLGDDDRAHAAQRPQLLAAVAAAARRHHHRARHLHRAEELRRRAGRTSTASASRKTTTCSTAST